MADKDSKREQEQGPTKKVVVLAALLLHNGRSYEAGRPVDLPVDMADRYIADGQVKAIEDVTDEDLAAAPPMSPTVAAQLDQARVVAAGRQVPMPDELRADGDPTISGETKGGQSGDQTDTGTPSDGDGVSEQSEGGGAAAAADDPQGQGTAPAQHDAAQHQQAQPTQAGKTTGQAGRGQQRKN